MSSKSQTRQTAALFAHLESYEIVCAPTLRAEWVHLSDFVTRKWHLTREALERAVVDGATVNDKKTALTMAAAFVQFRRTTDGDGNLETMRHAMRDAIMKNLPDVVEFLLLTSMVPDKTCTDAIRFAAGRGFVDIFRLLAHISYDFDSAIGVAVRAGHVEIVRLLLPRAVDLDYEHLIFQCGDNIEIVRLLIPFVDFGCTRVLRERYGALL